MPPKLLRLASLKKLGTEGFNGAILAMIEEQTSMQAVEMLALKGNMNPTREEVLGLCEQLLPQGVALYQLYAETKQGIASYRVDDLQRVGDTLSLAASHLERAAARAMTRPATLQGFATIHHSIATQYASLIQAARTIEQCGVIPVQDCDRLAKLTDRPVGPLSLFHDKALLLAEAPEKYTHRMRAAA